MLGEMAVALPNVRAFTEFARVGLGPGAGFVAGWLYWYFWIITVAVEAIAGATIQVKGTARTVVTDAKGEFEIRNVADDAVLVITSIGMQAQEVSVKGRNQVDIFMKIKASALDETVVTAFGVEKSSKEVGYSTATVKGEELTKGNTGNILSGLSGRVSGLNISTQSADMTPQMQVLMRGIRSFSSTSNNQPLFILNGSPLSFGSDQSSAQLILDFINNINPNDVEKVTILKGANATALYGPEGANGVIIITTRKGQKGKPVISEASSVNARRSSGSRWCTSLLPQARARI